MAAKKQAIFLDAVVLESCNLKCSYCRDGLIYKKEEVEQTVARVKKAIEIGAIADYDIFKISGYGEVTLLDNLGEISDRAKDKRLLVISNGTRLPQGSLEKILAHPDPALCISLDGHTEEMNSYRELSQSQIDAVVKTLKDVQGKGIPIEINSVITGKNIGQFPQFLEFLLTQLPRVMVFPFPVRPFPFMHSEDYSVSPAQLSAFEKKVIGGYEKYGQVLPPRAYLMREVEFIKHGSRSFVCTVPSFVIGINGNMDVLGCPCGSPEKLGNLNNTPLVDISGKLLSSKKGRWKECKNCFNHYEVISMYVDGKITGEEISRVPSISKPAILEHLRQIKGEYKHG